MPGPDAARAAMRSRQETEAAHERVDSSRAYMVASGSPYTSEPYDRGLLAALGWVLGMVELSPLSGQAGVDVSNPWVLTREQIQATEMLQGLRDRDRRGIRYISGVEHALMWVLGETDSSL